MTDGLIAVTGAGGELGARVAQRLAARGLSPRLLTRNPRRTPQPHGTSMARVRYDDVALLRTALAHVRTLFLVSASAHPDRLGLHRLVVEAAAGRGVRRIVYTSFVGAAPDATFTFARDHWHTEQLIRDSGMAYTFLRNNLYQDLLPSFADADGVIRGPAGAGRVAAVARDDIADVAAAVLRAGGGRGTSPHDGLTYDVTGPTALTLHEVADTITRVTGRTVTYEPQTRQEAYASRAHYGAPEWEVTGWVTSYEAIARGALRRVTDTVERVAGHPPINFEGWLTANHRYSGARLGR